MTTVVSSRIELKRLLSLMIPILITQFAQAGLGLIDTIMAGRFSALDLAAIAVGVGIWIPVMLLFTGILLATTPLVAEAVGAHNRHEIGHIVRQSLWMAGILGFIALVLLQFMPYLLPLFKVPEDLQPKAGLFLHAIGLGMPAVCLYTSLRCYSEAIGNPRPVTAISLLSLVILIPLNYLFMYGYGPIPRMGSAGCGFATATLQWLMLFSLILYISKAKIYQKDHIFAGFEKFNVLLAKRLLLLGFPIGLAIFFEVSVFSTAAIILSTLGDTVVAAHQIAISVTSQLFMLPMSLAIALTIRVGTYYGEKNLEAMRKVQKVGLMTATVMACLTMSFIALFRHQIISFYTQDQHVAHIAVYLLQFCIAYQLMDAWQVSAAGCLRGMQDTKAPMWATMLAYWVITLPLSIYWIRYASMGPQAVWISLIIGLAVACALLLSRLYFNNKKLAQKYKS
ncbi:MATE family efflux transporter [Acinetobacter sp. ESL0695]|uniref:Multidrug-efflux transporter n=1 Tax=Acinetobacter pollinis TaxID=2605270 RepID=A0ABU6DW75_9GAMM|nr:MULTISPECIES: MATE family efflux transporter [Acinetobacter]MEB5477668.1 MATE family efflux transporter [Acinetobacter pollinis]WEV49356.1 MATE family efflux transporter [Acinetobacter sp. ESL0695]